MTAVAGSLSRPRPPRHIGFLRHPVTWSVKGKVITWKEPAIYFTHDVTCNNTARAKANEPAALPLLCLAGESDKDDILLLAAITRRVRYGFDAVAKGKPSFKSVAKL